MRSLESHNKYPDCLWMQLEAIPVPSVAAQTQQLDIHLSLNFNEHWEPLLGGRVKFGLQGGTLKLNLENCEIPVASRQLVGDFELSPIDSSTEILSTESQREVRDNEKAEKIQETDCTFCHVSTIGDDTKPAWIFSLKRGKQILKGLLKSVKLGEFPAKPLRIAAAFEVAKEDIYLTDAEGLWPHDITPNQHSVLERILTVYLANKLQPALSWALLSYNLPAVEQPEVEIIAPAEAELQEMVDRIIAAETDDFVELATIANLNPALDFAGGSLRGTSLSAVDFSSANLPAANFRGANLNDADFSDANLQNAKFGGADLSGAFLGNADLSGADLYRASLALANLSGADFSRANLLEVNLTNANFSGANVKSARFGNNSGLAEDVKLNLQQRGAIFEDV
ncbi:MAG: pentapeptide repeat-containing protein [Microcoleus sp. PH2017_01_SCD_O_A]|uniref:pentapeptide repeat-containing protein n=1 Tax=unclassified Microcoleus TaxID=2642155 RepID=UPI001DE3E998|nr:MULTISPECIES: pentapeptide repeat-containing protein [unclassified Microcoleus]MCC3468823.1 pentapeptide repeat-containing protein [Microcoleus sp. PH2017_06_SFM_O_A]TAE41182.1 MAG: pentapeptide repeat-containing protein [Oscillatoriales cyanobacterium]MCC3428226.1 pentapeptide repeat-containing protein [Microcoleus sp. PH2017_01_SCD_O_A]MCC3474635.1 pentapeptide repeat-containing protein [Microcoleus sp. PH2017_13_LAR_U_A]MCC3487135.1 pentapeptide repeat-containing protein [Microcoleus sp.